MESGESSWELGYARSNLYQASHRFFPFVIMPPKPLAAPDHLQIIIKSTLLTTSPLVPYNNGSDRFISIGCTSSRSSTHYRLIMKDIDMGLNNGNRWRRSCHEAH
jgi:hypothetical protein